MKKLKTLLTIILTLSLVVVGCSSKSKSDSKSDGGKSYKIGIVTGEGGAKDKSFNQANVEAIQAWSKENGAKEPVIIETKNQSDLAANLQNAAKVSDIVSLAGYEFEKEISKIAEQYKDKKFLYVDSFVDASNIASLIFKEQEAAYLAGYAAALQSKTGKVGFIGGTKIPPVERFGIGFIQGAKAARPDIKIMYNYSGSFSDTNKGKTLAATMYDSGADVIFVAAGNTGNGVISEAKERGIIDMTKSGEIKHWVVGVDKDQYEEGIFKGKDKEGKDYQKSAILTSAVKNIEVAVTKILNEIKADKFENGKHIFGIKENGVGIPKENPNLSDEIKTKLNQAIEELKAEKVEVVGTADELKAKGTVTNIEGEL
ncbi:BMP family lipoprotein [Gemella cuniculi]|uniref:BMP family lipoprotein n=1 Tax=Gemella cuniculi TaxID=150240 RepID=UPI0003F6B14A|nr:BMP family ABC transporter substrate-binding protein [Gemella cuniculi]